MNYQKIVNSKSLNSKLFVSLQSKTKNGNRDVAQLVSVHVWGACGRQFESDHPDTWNA